MSKRGWLLFAAMSVIWGIPYLLIKIALEGMPAPFIVFARTAIGAAVLLPVAMRRGVVGPALKQWRYIAAFAALEIAGPWLLLGDAEQHMTSSLAGLLIAAVPFFVALIMWRLGDRSAVSGTRLAGLFIGLAGVVAIVGLNIGQVQVARMLEVIAVAVGYAIAPIIADRKLVGVPSLAIIAISLTGVALLYVPFAAFSHPTHMPRANALAAVIALGLICTASAFLLFFDLIAEAGPAKSSMITFVNPAVAVAGGVLFLGEDIKAGVIVGFPLVMVGLVLSTLRREGAAAAVAVADGPAQSVVEPSDCGPEAAAIA
ncbi:DMT family transporter [Catenulispora pinisilvae]|uniref:DMT family transporter n=1 Tax=Catenulispora pinisilvae TaxID=2705253 RepID=UPI0018916235|nr:EamA family transporter [Catenulispora pinisilvae]